MQTVKRLFGATGLVFFLISAWVLFTPTTVPAADSPVRAEGHEKAEDGKHPLKLDDVVVRGDLLTEGLTATSATVLDNSDIVDRIYVTPLDMLKLSPGITINQYHQGGTASAFQMRGFTGCSHGPDAAIFLDGVPLNETDGYADTNTIIPEEIDRVEIVKGPASALYGNYASAGSVAFHTIKSGDFTRAKLRYGSFDTADGVFTLARKEGRLDQVYAAQVYHTDGYQDNSEWNKLNGAGRWTYHFSDQFEATLGLRAFSSSWDSPGYIPEDVYNDSPTDAVSEVNGGKKDRREARLDMGYRLSDSSKVLLYGWTNTQDFTRWYQNWVSPAQAPGSNYGDERFFQRFVYGSGGSYNFLGDIAGREAKLVVGVDWMYERESRERWRLKVGEGRDRGTKYEDYDITLNTTGIYAEGQYQVLTPLRVILGARYDIFSGELDQDLPSATRGEYSRSGPEIFSPKGGLIYTVVEGWDLFANYGRGFALPRGTDLWLRDYLDPAIRTQYEGGLHARPAKWIDASLTFWRLDTTNDFQPTVSDPAVLENAGETRREGIEVGLNLYPVEHITLHVDYAYIEAHYLNFIESGVDREGNRLPSVPRHVANASVAYDPGERGWGVRLTGRWVYKWYINTANTEEADGFVTADAQASYRFNSRYRIALDVVNIFNKKYSEYAGLANNEKTYAPADPLSAYLTLNVDF